MFEPHADGDIDFVLLECFDGPGRRRMKDVQTDAWGLADPLQKSGPEKETEEVREPHGKRAGGMSWIEAGIAFENPLDLPKHLARCGRNTPPRTNELYDIVAVRYAPRFTEAELKEMLAFYKSPIGAKLLTTEPAIIDQSLGPVTAMGQQILGGGDKPDPGGDEKEGL
jgi:hypothetical protein